MTSSLVLEIFDSDKPTFLETDFSTESVGWIFIKTVDKEESNKAVKLLFETV